MDRFNKGQLTRQQPTNLDSLYRMVAQELGSFVFALIEGCAYVAWMVWKAFHSKPKEK